MASRESCPAYWGWLVEPRYRVTTIWIECTVCCSLVYRVRYLLLLPLPGVEGRLVLGVASLLPVVQLVTNLSQGTEVLWRVVSSRGIMFKEVLRIGVLCRGVLCKNKLC